MNAIQTILNIVLIVIDVALIVLVLAQQGKQAGLGAIAGGAETFLGKKKAGSMDALLTKLTRIAAIVFIGLSLAMLIIQRFSITPTV